MDKLESLMKPITSESVDKWKNSPDGQQTFTPRQLAIVALIQRTQAGRGLPLMSPGFELNNALKNWELALKAVPEGWLSRCYDFAAENWDWSDKRNPFTEHAVKEAYRTLIQESAGREASKRPARRDDTYRCWHCCDIGYQPLYYRAHGLWYSGQRPCICDATPDSQRQQFPLDETVWQRNSLGEYASRADIEKYGLPNKNFK